MKFIRVQNGDLHNEIMVRGIYVNEYTHDGKTTYNLMLRLDGGAFITGYSIATSKHKKDAFKWFQEVKDRVVVEI